MKSTLRNVFHSPRFLVGFIIFTAILLTVLIYPFFVTRDPLLTLGKGFLSPGTYVSVYDANTTETYRIELPEAAANRLEASLPAADRVTMIEFLTAKTSISTRSSTSGGPTMTRSTSGRASTPALPPSPSATSSSGSTAASAAPPPARP